MEHEEYMTRAANLEMMVKSVNTRIAEINEGGDYVLVENFKTLMKDFNWCKTEADELLNYLEVEDFLQNGPGRTRDIEYKKHEKNENARKTKGEKS